jgi:hypothetical protein
MELERVRESIIAGVAGVARNGRPWEGGMEEMRRAQQEAKERVKVD